MATDKTSITSDIRVSYSTTADTIAAGRNTDVFPEKFAGVESNRKAARTPE